MDSVFADIGEKNLPMLLSTLQLSMHPSTFVFLTFPPSVSPPPGLFTQMLFRELEGLTVISTLDSAQEYFLKYTFPCRMITCRVHSSLQAVGFIAELSSRLTQKNISVNPVSGYYHDHLFVPAERGQDALTVLEVMAAHADSKTAGQTC